MKLSDGIKYNVANQNDAELILVADRRRSDVSGPKLPKETLAAMGRAGWTPSNSVLYRSTMSRVG